MLPDVIRTARMVLRPWAPADVADVFSYAQDPEWSRFLPLPRPYTRTHAEQFIALQLLQNREQHPGWALQLGERVVGGINLRWLAAGRIGEFGYAVARANWRAGLATEAAAGVIGAAFAAQPLLERIQASACCENLASVRVLEKLGMWREGLLRKGTLVHGQLLDQVWYGLLREDWVKARGSPGGAQLRLPIEQEP
jgi:ribosomal-protein-alanine N-acetyltransferase